MQSVLNKHMDCFSVPQAFAGRWLMTTSASSRVIPRFCQGLSPLHFTLLPRVDTRWNHFGYGTLAPIVTVLHLETLLPNGGTCLLYRCHCIYWSSIVFIACFVAPSSSLQQGAPSSSYTYRNSVFTLSGSSIVFTTKSFIFTLSVRTGHVALI